MFYIKKIIHNFICIYLIFNEKLFSSKNIIILAIVNIFFEYRLQYIFIFFVIIVNKFFFSILVNYIFSN